MYQGVQKDLLPGHSQEMKRERVKDLMRYSLDSELDDSIDKTPPCTTCCHASLPCLSNKLPGRITALAVRKTKFVLPCDFVIFGLLSFGLLLLAKPKPWLSGC